MALPTLTRITDSIKVISIQDSTIDHEKTPRAVMENYATAQDLDVSKLILRNSDPTWFEVRPLNEHEVSLVGETGFDSSVDLTYLTCRIGIVSVENYSGFEEQRETLSGIQALTKDSLSWVPKETIQFLALCIWKISRLEERQKKIFSSKQPSTDRKAGTRKGNSTAAPAKPTQDSVRN